MWEVATKRVLEKIIDDWYDLGINDVDIGNKEEATPFTLQFAWRLQVLEVDSPLLCWYFHIILSSSICVFFTITELLQKRDKYTFGTDFNFESQDY